LIVLCGAPGDRPCLIDFANLITQNLSFLECVNIVDASTAWKEVETLKAKGTQWLQSNRIKAFYTVSRHTSFAVGAKSSLEMSGLGKLRPNLMLMGFKNNWKDYHTETRDFYIVIQSAFEINLSVAILRISEEHCHTSSSSKVLSNIHTSKSVTSIDSGMGDTIIVDSFALPTAHSQTSSHPEQSIGMKRSFLKQMREKMREKKLEPWKNLTQFRDETPVQGLWNYVSMTS
jgi:hypothetical protein